MNILQNVFRQSLLLLLLGSFALISACGFHLRGSTPLPSLMENVAVRGVPEGPLKAAIMASLNSAGGKMVEGTANASAVLSIVGEEFDQRVSSVDALGRASEYEMIYTLDFALLKPNGDVVVPEQAVTLSRLFRHEPGNVLGADTDQELLQRDMRNIAVNQMLRRLRTQVGGGAGVSPAAPTPPASGLPVPPADVR